MCKRADFATSVCTSGLSAKTWRAQTRTSGTTTTTIEARHVVAATADVPAAACAALTLVGVVALGVVAPIASSRARSSNAAAYSIARSSGRSWSSPRSVSQQVQRDTGDARATLRGASGAAMSPATRGDLRANNGGAKRAHLACVDERAQRRGRRRRRRRWRRVVLVEHLLQHARALTTCRRRARQRHRCRRRRHRTCSDELTYWR